RLPGARIAALIGLVLTHREAAEPSNLDAFSPFEGIDHRVEDAVHDELSFALRKLGALRDGLDELGLRHQIVASGHDSRLHPTQSPYPDQPFFFNYFWAGGARAGSPSSRLVRRLYPR